VNLEVAERLIDNLEIERIIHNQDIWLSDHTTVFVISEEDKWSCATSGCAAGFVYVEEAPVGFVFDTSSEFVFNSRKDFEAYENDLDHSGIRIDKWAGDVLGINHDQQMFLFYNFEDTEEIVNRIRFLIGNDDVDLYDPDRLY